jgi:RNA polymerase sigma factor (sigma-70 family)
LRHLVAAMTRSAAIDVRDDLLQCGQLGLYAAAMAYDPKVHDTRFLSYAASFIVYAILAGLRDDKREQVGRAKLGARLGVATLGARFLADESDRFSVIYDSKEINQRRLQTLSDQLIASLYVGLGASPLPDPEYALREAKSRAIASDVVRGVKARWSEAKRTIYKEHYEDGSTLTSIAAAHGVPLIRVRRLHKKMLDEIRAVLLEHGVDELPELGPGEDDEEDWP